jgi:sigma-B regulation protein RsbU (phosphoserine phosphatase)
MGQQTVLIAATHSAGDAPARWWRPIAAAWPRPGSVPPARGVALSEVISGLASPEPTQVFGPGSPLLIALGSDFKLTALCQLIDRLHQHVYPALILMPAVDPAARRLESGGVLIEPWDADPAQLAASLFALRERESTVRGLVRDLTISARYQGGVRGEMDRIHDELNLAAAVQQEMLPRRLPTVSGVDFGVLFRPAGYVSGDIYDVVELDDRHVAFFIADAVGHGVPAALMTMVISRSLRMTRTSDRGREIISPGEAMTRLNDELCRGKRENPRFSTAVYGVIDTRTRRVTLAGAGHPPPLRIRGRLLTRVETDGPLLGVFPGEKYQDTAFTLAEGETLLLYSDGFETAFAPPETGTVKRLSSDSYLKELAALPWPGTGAAASAELALSDLARRIDLQAGSLHQVDDVTAVAICAKQAASQAPPERILAAA